MPNFLFTILLVFVAYPVLCVEPVQYSFENGQYELHYSRNEKIQKVELKGRLTSYYSVGEGIEKLVKDLLVPGLDLEVRLHWAGGDIRAHEWLAHELKSVCWKSELREELRGRGVSRRKIWKDQSCRVITRIEKEKLCASSCIYLYMIGDHRWAHSTARFGFHSESIPTPWGSLKGSTRFDREIEYGINRDWLKAHASAFQNMKITYFKPHELVGSGILAD